MDITEDGISVRNSGKGRQCFIKTEFALRRREQYRELDALLLEEPENHLSPVNMKKLLNTLAPERQLQLFVATHSSHISSRLDLRRAILLGESRTVTLRDLSEDTARFFMKDPDNNVLDLALARRVILFEGDAEFILTDAFYRNLTGRTSKDAGVHIISIGGTSFSCYFELARLLGNRVAALRDNDGNTKLFYREHNRYGCFSMNWGASKGLDNFNDVCIVLGNTHWPFLIRNRLGDLPPSTRNKLYVTCSRSRGNIWFVPEKLLRSFRK